MSDDLDFVTLRKVNIRRCEADFYPLHSWSPTDWACAFAGEAGETCNEVKKLRRLDGFKAKERRRVLLDRIANEIADTVIYADLLAARLGIDLGAVVRAKFNAVSEQINSKIRLPETTDGKG